MISNNFIDGALHQARELYEGGFFNQAEEKLKKILSNNPENAEANLQYGLLLAKTERDVEAQQRLLAALSKKKGSCEYWLAYFTFLSDKNKLSDLYAALVQAQKYISLDFSFSTYIKKVLLYYPEDKSKAVVNRLFFWVNEDHQPITDEESLVINKELRLIQQESNVLTVHDKLVALTKRYPSSIHVWLAYSSCINQVEEYEKYIRCLARIASLDHSGKSMSILAYELLKSKRYVEAEYCAKRSLQLSKINKTAYLNLVAILEAKGRSAESYHIFKLAHKNLGNDLSILKALGMLSMSYYKDFEQALFYLSQASLLSMDDAGIKAGISQSYYRLNRWDRAASIIENEVIYLDTERVNSWSPFPTPILLNSVDEVDLCHSTIKRIVSTNASLWARNIDLSSLFYLAYHNRSVKDLFVNVNSFLNANCQDLNFREARFNKKEDRKVSVAFVSMFLNSVHTIGVLYKGFVEWINRNEFNVVVVHLPGSKFDEKDPINTLADSVVQLEGGIDNQIKAIASLNLDVIFYTDIGMSTTSYWLANTRIAPVQIVSWGHPVTSGIKNVDYYYSCEGIEPVGSDIEYSEVLVRNNQLPCYYKREDLPEKLPVFISNMISDDANVYACPQAIFKLHPDFDDYIFEVLDKDSKGVVVFVENVDLNYKDWVADRWRSKRPDLIDRIVFIDRMSRRGFLSFINYIDVLMDPIYFGSGNTMYEAFAYGIPIVTQPSQFMRGRIVSGAYEQMGCGKELVVSSRDEYVKMLIKVANNKQYQGELKKMIKSRAECFLFNDHKAVKELESFLLYATVNNRGVV